MPTPTTTTTVQCTVPELESVDHVILQVVAALNDLDVEFSKGSSISATVVRTSPFWSRSASSRAASTAGVARLFCTTGDATLLGSSDAVQAQVASWMESTERTVLPVLRLEESKRAALDEALLEYAAKISAWLFENDQTVLCGDEVTVADVVTALALSAALSNQKVPQQCYRWMQTVLQQIVAVYPSDTISAWSEALIEGEPSPVEQTVKADTTASAVVTDTEPAKKEVAPAPAPAAKEPAPVAETPSSAPLDAGENAILKLLVDWNIAHEVYDHKLSKTADELVANVPLPENESHTKNLFLRDKKHGLFLVTVQPDAAVHTKQLGTMLKLQGKTNLRLADEALLDKKLHVQPGCVGPLCMALADNSADLDPKERVTLVVDKGLLGFAKVHSHPLRNDQSVKMTPDALQEVWKKAGVEPVWLEFESASAAPKPEKLPGKVPSNRPPEAKKQEAPPSANKQRDAQQKKTAKKGETLLALQWKKQENFANWYTDVIVLSEMISYYDISGCYILRPWSYKMWELIQQWFNVQIQAMGVENAYFPMFVSQDRLEREKDHVEGFAPEVAWVTKSGDGDLAKPIAVRPTSETIMYPAYSDWIKSHRDLPLKLNQWSNVVRWEFKYPTPFLRTREFLWQEGHTAHATFEDADETVMQALELYRGVYEDLLAVPVVPGYKTEKEKFAGGFRTTTVEAYIAGSGRAIQGATSHNLGQNFGKMFDIKFQDEKGSSQVAWQTSWGLTTRTIGVMVMVHGDDTGLVLPPRVAPIQVVIVPILSKKLTVELASPYCEPIIEELKANGIRVKYDDRLAYNPGWKYNHWEQKGVPIRVEVGPRDVEQKSVRVVIRHDGSKEDYPVEGLGERLKSMLDTIQSTMFEKAKAARDSHIATVTEWKDFVPELEKNMLVMTPWCGGEHQDWEEWVKTKSRDESLAARGEEEEDDQTATSVAAKTLCIPFKQPELPAGTKCIASGMDATCWVLWGRSY